MSPRDRRAIILGAAVVGLVALAWLVVFPWLDHWAGVRRRIDDAGQRMEELERQTQLVAAMNRQLEPLYGQAVAKPLTDLATARRELVRNVLGLHEQAGVGVGNLTPETDRPLTEVPGVVRLAVMVRASCRSAQLVQLLNLARSGPMLLALDRIESANNPQQPGTISVTLVWYTLARTEAAMTNPAWWKARSAQWGERALVALAALLAAALIATWVQAGRGWWAVRRLTRTYAALTGVAPASGARPPTSGDEMVKRLSTSRVVSPKPRFDLTGVLGDRAIFNGSMALKAGDMAGDMKILTIGPDWIEVESNGEHRKLFVFTSQAVSTFPRPSPAKP